MHQNLQHGILQFTGNQINNLGVSSPYDNVLTRTICDRMWFHVGIYGDDCCL